MAHVSQLYFFCLYQFTIVYSERSISSNFGVSLPSGKKMFAGSWTQNVHSLFTTRYFLLLRESLFDYRSDSHQKNMCPAINNFRYSNNQNNEQKKTNSEHEQQGMIFEQSGFSLVPTNIGSCWTNRRKFYYISTYCPYS